jgi:glycosyltransferase involved in cell wall biosynthesis
VTEKPLRILLTDPHLKGGGQVRYVANLARELTRRGHHIVVGCKPGSVLEERAREASCPCHNQFIYKGGLRPRTWWHDLSELRRFIRQEKPDILHANGSQDHWISAIGNRLMGSSVCMVRTRHNTYTVHDALPNRVLNRDWTDFQFVVCETVRAGLAQQPAFDASRMRSMHNGVDADEYKPNPEARAKARAEFGYTDDHVVLGMAARFVPAKGHEFLFRAIAGLTEEFPNLRILLLGQGDLEDNLKELAQDLGIGAAITFAGYRDDMRYCMQAFDIGVQPSIDCEASSFSLMEQMALEKPIVTSTHGGSKEIVRDGVDGFVVAEGTVDPLREALHRVISDAGLRLKMGRSCRGRILDDFTIQRFADRTLEGYAEAIGVHRKRRGQTQPEA